MTTTIKPVFGIWTPWAEVLCYACHGQEMRTRPGRKIPDAAFQRLLGDYPGSEAPCRCDKCGRPICVEGRDDVTTLGAMRDRINDAIPGAGAHLDQTGGMCVGLAVPLEQPAPGSDPNPELVWELQIGLAENGDPDDLDRSRFWLGAMTGVWGDDDAFTTLQELTDAATIVEQVRRRLQEWRDQGGFAVDGRAWPATNRGYDDPDGRDADHD